MVPSMTNTLPDPNLTGPCNLQASPFCDNQGRQRLDPMDMLDAGKAFAEYTSACDICYDARADEYVSRVHGR